MLKCKVFMLPTEKASSLVRHQQKNIIDQIILYDDGPRSCKHSDGFAQQYLYFTSDREIKEGDYFIEFYENFPNRVLKAPKPLHDKTIIKDVDFKIEATTDPSLRLPLIPQLFIEVYVEKQGKIDEVMIEMSCNGLAGGNPMEHLKPTTRKDNTAIIHKLKDSWTREEVVELIKRNTERLTNSWLSSDIEWVEKNL